MCISLSSWHEMCTAFNFVCKYKISINNIDISSIKIYSSCRYNFSVPVCIYDKNNIHFCIEYTHMCSHTIYIDASTK